MKHLSLLFALMFALTGCGDDDASDAATPDASDSDTSGSDDSGSDTSGSDDSGGDDSGSDDSGSDDSGSDDSGSDDTGPADASADATSAAECTVDADCMMVSNCCECGAAPTGTVVDACVEDCLVPFCQSAGIEAVACKAGVCVLDRVDCDESRTTCDVIPPACEPGTTPHIVNECYSGLCVPVEACAHVASCDDCTADQTCVTFSTMLGPQYNCAPTPASCGDTPDCACLGDEICESPYMCNPGTPLTCVCPVC